MRIAAGADHGGRQLKDTLVAHLRAAGHEVEDLGTHGDGSVDYPSFAIEVARRVLDGSSERGLLICGTGQGMAMTVNKIGGLRAAVVSDTFSAKMAIAHNDARVLCLGQRVVGPGLAQELVEAWLATEFEGGRHGRRVDALEEAGGIGASAGGRARGSKTG